MLLVFKGYIPDGDCVFYICMCDWKVYFISKARWTGRSGCLGEEIAVGISRRPLSLNQEGDRE